jgi:hypothetical protein
MQSGMASAIAGGRGMGRGPGRQPAADSGRTQRRRDAQGVVSCV